jgi:pimeloyl-ACP methyl ester carboxylesterase
MATRQETVDLAGVGKVPLTVNEQGVGPPILLLHGGGGPLTVSAFAELLARSVPARVLTPVHPGFGGTPRPERLDSVRALASLYVAFIEQSDLSDVTVIGNSVGGWIAAEMGLLGSNRIKSIVLVDAVGIDVPGHPVIDFFSLPISEIADYSYHQPDRFRIDPATMPDAQRQAMAGNREALAVYAGKTSMTDATLAGRLAGSTVPTLVVWGESDRIVDPEYGRAYAAAIPGAKFVLLDESGHMPQLETPDKLLSVILGAESVASATP